MVHTTRNRADVTRGWRIVSTVQVFVTEACCVLCERSNSAASNPLTAPGCLIATVVQAELPVALPPLPHTTAILRPCPSAAVSSPPPHLHTGPGLKTHYIGLGMEYMRDGYTCTKGASHFLQAHSSFKMQDPPSPPCSPGSGDSLTVSLYNGLLINLVASVKDTFCIRPQRPGHAVFAWCGVFSDLSHKNSQSWPQCAYPLEPHTFTEGQRAHTKLILQCALLMLLFIFIGSPSGNNSVPLLTSSVNVTGKSYKFRVSSI